MPRLKAPVLDVMAVIGARQGALLVRARRLTRRGEYRKAMLALREACCLDDDDPRLWALYAAACWRARRSDDAADALARALWLRGRERDEPRCRVLRALLERLLEGGALPLQAA